MTQGLEKWKLQKGDAESALKQFTGSPRLLHWVRTL